MQLMQTSRGSSGASSSVFINSTPVANPNFNDTTPANANFLQPIAWQASGSDVSAYQPLPRVITLTAPGPGLQVVSASDQQNFDVFKLNDAGFLNVVWQFDPTIPRGPITMQGFNNSFNDSSKFCMAPAVVAGFLVPWGSSTTISYDSDFEEILTAGTCPIFFVDGTTFEPGAGNTADFRSVDGSIDITQATFGGINIQMAVRPQNTPAVSHQWINSYDDTTGVFGQSQPSYSDISGSPASGTVLWSALGNAAGALTLANGTNATTFNHTSAVNWTWANTTAATAAGAESSSPILNLNGQIWSAGANTVDSFSFQNVITTGAISKTVTNISETSGNIVTLTVGASHGFVINNWATFTGLTVGTWLNGQNVRITSVAGTTITFTDPTSHGTQASTPETGTATLVRFPSLVLTHSGGPLSAFDISSICASNDVAGGANPDATTGLIFGGGWNINVQSPTGSMYFRGPASGAVVTYYTAGTAGLSMSLAAGQTILNHPTANGTIALRGNLTTNTTNAAISLGNTSSMAAVSGTQQVFVQAIGTFAPASGASDFVAMNVLPTINQTGSSSGNYIGLRVNAVETALKGTSNLLLDLQSGATGGVSRYTIDPSGITTQITANTGKWIQGQASELLTLSTVGLTTDTTANLLPAGAIIQSVVCRVTTTITTTTNWAVGDPTTAARFSAANATLTSGTTSVGIDQWSGAVTTLAAGPSQAAAAKVRITCTGANPGAGVIRITVFYSQFVAPTS